MKMVKYVILKTGKWEGSLTAPFIYPLGIWCAASRIALNNSSMFFCKRFLFTFSLLYSVILRSVLDELGELSTFVHKSNNHRSQSIYFTHEKISTINSVFFGFPNKHQNCDTVFLACFLTCSAIFKSCSSFILNLIFKG